ncbi:MAG TPA: cupredoxin family copper-binding protein [Planctomycetota bacterium]|nr:cupredoxin family copper-binding protein [Planctomycetota bacterium]
MIRSALLSILFAGAVFSSHAANVAAPCCAQRAANGRATTSVSIVDFDFKAASITVTVGDTVTWTNDGGAPHDVTSDPPGAFASGTLSSGQTFSFTFNTPGTFQYLCTIHPNMRGTVIVQAAGGSSSPGNLSGSFSGKAKAKSFNLAGSDGKFTNESRTVSATYTQDTGTLSADVTLGSKTYKLSGKIGNTHFWLSGQDSTGTETITLTGHVSKKGDSVKGIAIVTAQQKTEELGFSMKKQ